MGDNGFNNSFKTHRIKLMMSMSKFLVAILVLLCAGSSRAAATAKPLEHSPGELAYAAWLQQESRHQETQFPPRRITTKSLFVFPHLGSEALPACPDGERMDGMGRCVKIIKVDEKAHLEFLLNKLNSQFATETAENTEYDYDGDSDASDTSGPFQINIPIALPSNKDELEGSGDNFLIYKKDPNPEPQHLMVKPVENDLEKHNSSNSNVTVVASTNGKFDSLSSDDGNEETTTESTTTVSDFTSTTDLDMETTTFFDVETTTLIENLNKETIREDGLLIIKNQDKDDAKPIVEQIEALKIKNKDKNQNDQIAEQNTRLENYDKPIKNPPTKLLNIEDKIKMLSQIAEVTRNSQDFKPKHRPEEVDGHRAAPNKAKPSDGDPFRYPPNSPTFKNNFNIQNHPLYHGTVPPKIPYQWVPQPWKKHHPQNSEDILSVLSQMPIAPEYQYGYNNYNQQIHYPYPNAHHSGSRINLRHTTVNHRRARPMFDGYIHSDHSRPIYEREQYPSYK